MTALMPRQQDCLDAIRSLTVKAGRPPSYDEIARCIGLQSKSGVHRLITGLIARGAVRRAPNAPRSIEIINEADRSSVLRFLDSDTRDRVIHRADRTETQPEQVIADICRRYFFQ